MKKILLFFLFFAFIAGSCQKKKVQPAPITAESAEMSNDPKVIATFIKANPDHPKTETLKAKLYQLISPADDPEAKPKVEALSKGKLVSAVKRDIRDGVNDKNKQTAEVLTHLFNNDVNKKQAYVQIVNRSKCNLVVKFSGKKFYNLDVKAMNKNFILVDKGNYKLTTMVCDAKYDTAKGINKDITISLNSR